MLIDEGKSTQSFWEIEKKFRSKKKKKRGKLSTGVGFSI